MLLNGGHELTARSKYLSPFPYEIEGVIILIVTWMKICGFKLEPCFPQEFFCEE